jgi:hypothetical protein
VPAYGEGSEAEAGALLGAVSGGGGCAGLACGAPQAAEETMASQASVRRTCPL